MFNAFILRLDVIMLGWFIGRAPGVTSRRLAFIVPWLGLRRPTRKVNQRSIVFAQFSLFGMTATGDQQRAAATLLLQWML